ncbi:hypothetical protein M408DRAFT_22339 [Serendipita vermifera MAFF 305830]|uniref:Intradiol ring-cleavage dioxygenases domain-containing protein n=1 Tax=Serendipita vermifera MAFF 305830 TaxID=933852 RepID=A0A0C2WW05_SERVB|nr:hypothetical protein M408DRAFT_22339 [Serendipita vermifera MAFF 305830]
MRLQLLTLALISFAFHAFGHAEASIPLANQRAELSRRQLEANKRHVMARDCASHVATYHKQRKAKRALGRIGSSIEKRDVNDVEITEGGGSGLTNSTSSGAIVQTEEKTVPTPTVVSPHYSTIQNFVRGQVFSVIAPISCFHYHRHASQLRSPYYLRDDYVRQDLREDQNGTTLYLDVGVLDITTCQPVTDAFVEIWACNAQGDYSAFINAPRGPWPTSPKTTGDNFLRGGYTVDDNGVVELITIYPGFYTGRTVHIHTMVHQDISYHTNGTIMSASGGLRHIGQLYFDEAVNTEVLAQAAYKGSKHEHNIDNTQDYYMDQANSNGYSAFIDVEKLENTLDDGLLGYITIGIDTSASYGVFTDNYWDSNFEPK